MNCNWCSRNSKFLARLLKTVDGEREEPRSRLEIGRIVPIYESAGQGSLTPAWFRRIIHTVLENLAPEVPDPIPAVVRKQLSLIASREALWRVHWPDAGESLAGFAILAYAGAHSADL